MSDIIALIPARGESKSIPGKNIKLLAGRPLIAWTITAALASRKLSRVIVSTDDQRIARISRKWGAEVPFMRPAELARDDSSSFSVVEHALRWLKENEGHSPKYVMFLQPPAPLRTTADIDAAIRLMERRKAVAVVSVCSASHHPYICKRILDDGTMVDFMKSNIPYLRRQDLPPVYALNGAIYLNRSDALLREKTFWPKGTLAYVMPRERSFDLDTLWDFKLLDLLQSARKRRFPGAG